MIKKYKIDGLDCPNCAKALEKKICELNSVKNAKIDFLKSTLEIEADDDRVAVLDAIKLAQKIEPDATIVYQQNSKKNNRIWLDLVLLIAGLFIGIVALLVEMPKPIFLCLFILSALLVGYKTYLKAFNLLTKKVVNENILVTISVIGAGCVGEYFDSLMVIVLYTIGKILESVALDKSKKSIESLAIIKPMFANVLRGDKEVKIDPTDIKIGDVVVVRAGEKIAVDGIVKRGDVSLNTQSLTGESLPKQVGVGDEVLSGMIVLDGVVHVEAKKVYEDSAVAKILDLIENAKDKKAKTETVISKISKWYTLAVIGLAVCVWGVVWAVTKSFDTAIYRGLIFLVVSCPCAFAISVPLAYFSGIGNASSKGILIKGSNYLDALAKMDMIVFDKTGTLTTGEFEIVEIKSLNKHYSSEDILNIGALGEQYSNHPLAKAIVKYCDKELDKADKIKELAGSGIEYFYHNNKYFVGRKNKTNSTMVEVYCNDELIGQIYLKDKIKDTAKMTISNLDKMGIKSAMLSGDSKQIVENVGATLGISIAKGELLPEDKFEWIEEEKKKGKVIGYVGDGINDAPSLTLADVGIGMGLNGSSASLEASNIVLANDNPQKIVDGIKISRLTNKIVWQNIIISAIIKIIFLSLGAFGVTGMLSAVIADVGVTLVAIFNSLRALKFNPHKNKKHGA